MFVKNKLFLLFLMLSAVCGCKKESQPGSQYTRQMTGTRNYAHVSYRSFADPNQSPVTTIDTVALSIDYVNDATVQVKTYTLIFNPTLSSDNISVYNVQYADFPPASVKLSYNRAGNSIEFRIDSYEIATPNYDVYQSL